MSGKTADREKYVGEKLTPILQVLVSDVIKEMPDSPRQFMKQWLAEKIAAAGGGGEAAAAARAAGAAAASAPPMADGELEGLRSAAVGAVRKSIAMMPGDGAALAAALGKGRTLNILLQEDLTIRGGAQLWLMNCGSRMKDAGHIVTFLLPEDSLLRPDIEAMQGVQLRTYEHGKSAEDPEAYRALFTELLTPANVCVTLVRQRRGKFQNVDFMASCIDKANLKTFLVAKTGTPDPSYEKCFYGGALLDRNPPQSTVITIADYTRSFIIEKMGVDGKYITNIYNGTDTQKFKRTPEMAVECLKRYPLKEGDFVVGCIGSFEQRKGQKDLLDAAKVLIADGRIPNIHLLMVGEGPDKEMLVKTIEEQGLQNNATIFDFTKEPFYVFERCNVIALPSYKEGLPNVLLEALAMEKPCVASRIMGCPEVVRDNVTGFCFECGNVKEIADSIANIHSLDKAKLAEMAAAGKKLVFEEHDKAKQFEKILDVIQSNAC